MSVTLQPGRRYQLAISPGPGALLERVEGAFAVPDAGRLHVGGSIEVGANGAVFASQPVEIDVTGGTLHPWSGGVSAVDGATAALRRLIDTVGVTPAPALPTDGVSLRGCDWAWLIVQTDLAGAVDLTLREFNAVAETWDIDEDFGVAGVLNVAPGSSVREMGRAFLLRGLDRIDVQVSANAGGAQVDAWMILCYEHDA